MKTPEEIEVFLANHWIAGRHERKLIRDYTKQQYPDNRKMVFKYKRIKDSIEITYNDFINYIKS